MQAKLKAILALVVVSCAAASAAAAQAAPAQKPGPEHQRLGASTLRWEISTAIPAASPTASASVTAASSSVPSLRMCVA